MPHYHEKDLFDYVAAVVPVLAVLVAVAVGAIQLYLQKRQFGLAYFQERFGVYASTRQFFVSILDIQGPSDPNVLEDFIEGTAHAEFLFGEDVTKLRETIIGKARLLLGSIALSGGVGTTQFLRYRPSVEQFLLEADASESNADSSWRQQLEGMQQEVNRVFHGYLQIHPGRNWFARVGDWVDSRPDVLTAGRYGRNTGRNLG
jgi:hypothetical protein